MMIKKYYNYFDKKNILVLYTYIMTEEVQPLVIDFGSGFTKAGFAYADEPKSIFPSAVSAEDLAKKPIFATKLSAKSFILLIINLL